MIRNALLTLALLTLGTAAWSQAANVALGTGGFDSALPVEVTADELSVDQADGRAVFDGNVLVVQGEVRLSAGRVEIEYAAEGSSGGIARLVASGGVTFVTAAEAAEAQEAVYSVEKGEVTLSGDVLLTQGGNALAGDRMVVDLASGNGRMEGRVRTVFTPGEADQ